MPISPKHVRYKKNTTPEGFELSYKLTEDVISCKCTLRPSYSLFVSVRRDGYYDEKLVNDLTSCEQTALEIFRLVSDGLVTPITLLDVLEDLL